MRRTRAAARAAAPGNALTAAVPTLSLVQGNVPLPTLAHGGGGLPRGCVAGVAVFSTPLWVARVGPCPPACGCAFCRAAAAEAAKEGGSGRGPDLAPERSQASGSGLLAVVLGSPLREEEVAEGRPVEEARPRRPGSAAAQPGGADQGGLQRTPSSRGASASGQGATALAARLPASASARLSGSRGGGEGSVVPPVASEGPSSAWAVQVRGWRARRPGHRR
jgi:hypothetical protein